MKRISSGDVWLIFIGCVALLVGYILLNNIYMEGVNTCSNNYEVDYCASAMSR